MIVLFCNETKYRKDLPVSPPRFLKLVKFL